MEKKGIGPQGLGVPGHNGFWIGSPLKQKCWPGYKAEGKKKSPSGKKTKGVVFILVDVQKGKRNKINRRTIPNVPK